MGKIELRADLANVFSRFKTANATPEASKGALNAGMWFRRDRFVVVGPDSRRILAGFRQKITLSSSLNLPSPLFLKHAIAIR
jgi:hypothetical protein